MPRDGRRRPEGGLTRVTVYRRFVALLALVTLGLGVAILAVTLAHGVGETGLLVGALFVAAGAGRLYLELKR